MRWTSIKMKNFDVRWVIIFYKRGGSKAMHKYRISGPDKPLSTDRRRDRHVKPVYVPFNLLRVET